MNAFNLLTAQLALDLTAERTRAASRHARLFAGAGPDFDHPRRVRQRLARLATLLSRRSEEIARRLDPSLA